MALLDDVKISLRITTAAFDGEIQDLIDSARLDLIESGVSATIVNNIVVDPWIKRAITVYAKGNFGYDNPDADRFQESYRMLKIHLALSGDYGEVYPDATP